MQFKLLNLNNSKKDYKFNLSAINEHAWKCFVYDVVLNNCASVDNVSEIRASITIRENLAKVMIGYQDVKYNELSFTLSPNKTFVGKQDEVISEVWRSTLAAVYGAKCLEEIQAESNLIQD